MLETMRNAWKIDDIRKKLQFTLVILLLYRIGNSLNQVAKKAHTLNVIDVQRYDVGVCMFESAVKQITEAVVEPKAIGDEWR